MDAIVAWDAETPQWPEVLAVGDGKAPSAKLSATIMWRIYGPLCEARAQRRGFVIGQAGQSLDGRIATASGHSHYINGPAAIVHLHRLRALVDAVVVGVGTVVADNPRLTVRGIEGPQPARVVIDPNGRAPVDAKCFAADGVRRIVLSRVLSRAAGQANAEYAVLAQFTPAAILGALRDRGLMRVLVEGGAATLSHFLAGRVLDRLHVMTAPLIIGSGKPGLVLPEIATLKDALRPATATYLLPGGDVLFDCDFRA
jgi:diaminohydroxyphosphoribosylaminopyrimidine deaminase/5-amino-6-(5-phosphoribosylamino)uracil reductase